MNNAPFGTVLGYAPGRVPVYSSDYDTADEKDYPDRHAYRSYIDGEFMGYKWQCVEFARRWLYLNKGYSFDTGTVITSDSDVMPLRIIDDDDLLEDE